MIEKWFPIILSMTQTASYIAFMVIVIRFLLRKLPKGFAYILWLPVWVRLISPISFYSDLSILRLFKPISLTGYGEVGYTSYNIGIDKINNAMNSSLLGANPVASADPMYIFMKVASMIWIVGIAVLLGYTIFSYAKIAINIRTATLVRDNIFETDQITTPFVWGIIKPRIYIPVGLARKELVHVLAHEQFHIRRKDYIVKPLTFLILIVHWFNPMVWISFMLMGKDMEMSCDEGVVEKIGIGGRKDYSNSLLSLSEKRSILLMGNPFALGEGDTKSRIKNILYYKKPSFWAIMATIMIMIGLFISLLANPINNHTQRDYFGYDVKILMDNQTPYVGDAGKVLALIDAMPLPEGVVRDSIELQTKNKPYEITINYHMNDVSALLNPGAAVRELSGEFIHQHAMILYSLIDNVDVIRGVIIDQTGENNGAGAYVFNTTRETGGVGFMDEDVRVYAKNADTLRELIEKVVNTSFLTYSK